MIKEYGSKILYVSKNNKVAVSLYEKFGFKVTDTFDTNMLVMERGSSKMKTLKESSIFDSIKLV
jgi:ribosomal protein S18 acetylase RimI-like enzyme